MDTIKLADWAGRNVPIHAQTPSQLSLYDPDHVPSWDAMAGAVSLCDLAADDAGADVYSALGEDGIDAYTGADTVLNGTHDHALMLVGFAMIGIDDE